MSHFDRKQLRAAVWKGKGNDQYHRNPWFFSTGVGYLCPLDGESVVESQRSGKCHVYCWKPKGDSDGFGCRIWADILSCWEETCGGTGCSHIGSVRGYSGVYSWIWCADPADRVWVDERYALCHAKKRFAVSGRCLQKCPKNCNSGGCYESDECGGNFPFSGGSGNGWYSSDISFKQSSLSSGHPCEYGNRFSDSLDVYG